MENNATFAKEKHINIYRLDTEPQWQKIKLKPEIYVLSVLQLGGEC